MKFRNAVFVVTETCPCPLYNVGEEFIMEDYKLTVADDKRVCLLLMQQLFKSLTDSGPPEQEIGRQDVPTATFECGGCDDGLLRFKRKKEATCSCLQMNLHKVAEPRTEHQLADQLFSILREMELFEPLSDIELRELALLMKVRHYPADEVIITPGGHGTHLYIVLTGTVRIVVKKDDCTELGPGGTFGEMSLLSGETVCPLVYSRTAVQLACLHAQDIKRMLSSYPGLQIFFYRLLVRRTEPEQEKHVEDTEKTRPALASMSFMPFPETTINSGCMSGELTDYTTLVDLFQILNTGGKTGKIDLTLPEGDARVLFHEGEIIQSSFGPLQGKAALFALLGQQNSSFTYTNGLSDAEKDMPILGGFVGLLMEGLLHLDERKKIKQDGCS